MVTRQQQAQHAAPCNLNFGIQVSPRALRYPRTPTPWIVDRSLQTNGARILIFGDETTGSVGLEQDMNHLSGFVFWLACCVHTLQLRLSGGLTHLSPSQIRSDRSVFLLTNFAGKKYIARTSTFFWIPAFFFFQVDRQHSFVSKNDFFKPTFPSKCFLTSYAKGTPQSSLRWHPRYDVVRVGVGIALRSSSVRSLSWPYLWVVIRMSLGH